MPAPSSARPAQQPIESRSFDALLDEARALTVDDLKRMLGEDEATRVDRIEKSGNAREGGGVKQGGLMQQLAQVDRIENAALRGLVQGNER